MIGPSISEFSGNNLKSIDVLKRYFNFDRRLSETDKISKILNEIKFHYDIAGVAITSTEHIRLKLKKLIKDAKIIISKRKSSSQSQLKNENEFFNKINTSFDVVKKNPSNELNSNPPIASSLDSSTRSNSEIAGNSSPDDSTSDSEYELPSYYESTEDELRAPRKKIQISNEILEKIEMSSKLHTSFEEMSTFIKIGIELAGGDPKNYSISRCQIYKQLSELRSKKKSETLTQLSDGNSKLLIHFDTKSCRKLNKRHLGLQNRLVVIFRNDSSATTIGPLAVDNHESSTIAQAIIDLIIEHHLENRIVALSCDTEFANTGRLNGVCIRIERFLERQLLHCMCRHHVYELILKHVGEHIFGTTSGPTFNFESMNLKRSWENIDFESFTPHFGDNVNVNEFRENAIQILSDQMNSKMTRDDYAELTDLTLKFFGESNTEKKSFMVPSAMGNARWMQKAIYALKAYLFRDQIQVTDRVILRLEKFSAFISAVYVKYWNRSSNLFEAPINDLELLKELERYRAVDENIANVALNALKRHLYYLSDELVVVSIFSKHLSHHNKEMIRNKLCWISGPRTEHSIRHIADDNGFSTLQMHDFITNRSFYLFSLLELDVSFLNHNANTWDELQSYQNAKEQLISLLPVINDHSERILGQTSNAIMNQKAKNEHNLQKLFSVKFNK